MQLAKRHRRRSLTRPQLKALEFFEREANDPAAQLLARGPNPKTRNWLLEHQYVEREPVGQFDYWLYQLTARGRELLAERRKR